MAEQGIELLAHAVARNAPAVISLPADGELHHHKTRFLARDEQGLWLESIDGQGRLIEALSGTAAPVGVSFRGGTLRMAFFSRIVKADKDFRVGAGSTVDALLLAEPAEVTAIQRRASYRVAVPMDAELRLRVWRIADHVYVKDRPPASSEIPCVLRNISVGGIGVMLQPRRDPRAAAAAARLEEDARLRLEFFHREDSVILEGRVRHPERAPDETPPGGFYTGVQFAKLEDNLEGRQALAWINSIIAEFQREEVKRSRGEGELSH